MGNTTKHDPLNTYEVVDQDGKLHTVKAHSYDHTEVTQGGGGYGGYYTYSPPYRTGHTVARFRRELREHKDAITPFAETVASFTDPRRITKVEAEPKPRKRIIEATVTIDATSCFSTDSAKADIARTLREWGDRHSWHVRDVKTAQVATPATD